MSSPRVSVVMIFLDGERFMDEAVASVVAQTFTDWELVLVDDGSTDGSTAIAQRWAAADERIRYLDHDGHANLGMSASRNRGIAEARGDLITFLDCDDIWLPDHLAPQVATLDADALLDATYGAHRYWYSWSDDLDDVERDHQSRLGVEPDTVQEPGELLLTYRRDTGTLPAICSVLLRRAALLRLGGFAVEFRGCFEDQVMLAKLGLHLRVHVSGDSTVLYRRHDASACAIAIERGTYHPMRPNVAEHRYLQWLDRYLVEQGEGDSETRVLVRRALADYRNPLSAPARRELRRRAHLGLRWRRKRLQRALGRAA